jgi:hypothetical protein
MHFMLSLSISYPDLIKFHDFADNSQEGMKHQTRGATQAQEGQSGPAPMTAPDGRSVHRMGWMIHLFFIHLFTLR